jgi:uncharacterized protein YecT (DUF1311 family)
MRRIITLTACLLLTLTLGAAAQNQHELNIAAGKEFEQADHELNAVYKQLMARLDKDEQKKLVTAEQAWIKFRDADCKFAASPNEGGSIYPLVYAGALTAKTLARTEELRGYLEDYAGR